MSAQLDQLTAQAANDPDTLETKEWLEALEAVIENEGPERAHYLMERLVDLARRRGAHIPFSSNTAYVNTIPAHLEEHCPGNLEYEERLRSWMRWNAMAMVVKANRADGDLGGHISSASPRWPTCSASASTTSGTRRPKTTAATCCTSRATRRPASTRAPSSKAA